MDSRKRGLGVISSVVALPLYDGIWLTSWYLGQKYTKIGEAGPPIFRSHLKSTIMENRGHLGRGWAPHLQKSLFQRVLS
jgi:hypothetical protein